MNLRNLSIIVAILAVLCAVAWVLRRPAPPASDDARVGSPVLASDLAGQAARVRIADAGKSVELARAADGSWTVPSYHDFPADFAKLSRLVTDLTEAKVRRLVTSRPDRLARLEFKDTSISMSDAAGKELWQVDLGKNAEGGGRFLRYRNEDKGYLANLSLWIDTEPKNWADAVILALKSDELGRIEIGFTDGAVAPVVLARATKDGSWGAESVPEGQRLKADRITSLVSGFSSLRFSETAAPDDERAVAARAHSRTLKFTNFDGKSWIVTLGRTPEEKRPKQPSPGAETTKPGGAGNSPEADRVGPNALSKPATESSTTTETEKAGPEFETVPAGPVFVTIACSDANARINALMQRRAFQVSEWTYTSLPAAPADLFEPAAVEAPKAASP